MSEQTSITAQIQAASDKCVPFVLLVTQDAPAAQSTVVQAMAGDTQDTANPSIPVFAYSGLLGLRALNAVGEAKLGEWLDGQDPSMLADVGTFARVLAKPRCECVITWWGADRAWSDPAVATALLEVRDTLASARVTLVGLGSGQLTAGDLISDVHTIRDPLPDDGERAKIVRDLCDGNDVATDESTLAQAVNVSRGLTRFAVSQVTGLATRGTRLDVEIMASRWREQLAGLPGVSVERSLPVSYYGGNAAWIDYLRLFEQAGVSLVVQLDEIEKCVPNPDSRDGGASASILGELLTYLNDSEPGGAIAEGIPGTGKSLSALVAGSMFACPVVRINPGKFKGSLVGESERNAGRVFSVLRSFGGLQFWIATSNRLDTVPEELSDRFPGGVWFFDLPTADERPAIWRANLMRYGFTQRYDSDEGWTGRDVRAVCLEAKRTKQALATICEQRIPGSRRMAGRIEKMRTSARSEAYRSATTGLAYAGPSAVAPSAPVRLRTRGEAKPVFPSPTDEDTF